MKALNSKLSNQRIRKLYIITIANLLIINLIFAQSPEMLSYQAVIRDVGNNLVTSQPVGMHITILQGSASGTAVYVETQTPNTNANGLISIEIGGNNANVVSGTFSSIEWASGTYYLKTEIDPSGGTNYTITGTSQLLSVPYALHAKIADNIKGEVNYTETDPVFDAWDKSTGISITESQVSDFGVYIETEVDPEFDKSVASGITATDTANWNNKPDSFTETQNLENVLSQNNSAGNNNITNLADPSNSQDAATKAYVDYMIGQLSKKGIIVADADGNIYSTVRIGSQVWMAENLRTTKYNDGSPIPLVTDNTTWSNLTTPAYCWYDNDSITYASTYGALYNWYTVETGGLCPTGWHVPTDAEWTSLIDYLIAQGYSFAGIHADNTGKSLASLSGWCSSSNLGAIGNTDFPTYRNKTGFTALPSGSRVIDGGFFTVGNSCSWWSATEYSDINAYSYGMNCSFTDVYSNYHDNKRGESIRCLRD